MTKRIYSFSDKKSFEGFLATFKECFKDEIKLDYIQVRTEEKYLEKAELTVYYIIVTQKEVTRYEIR